MSPGAFATRLSLSRTLRRRPILMHRHVYIYIYLGDFSSSRCCSVLYTFRGCTYEYIYRVYGFVNQQSQTRSLSLLSAASARFFYCGRLGCARCAFRFAGFNFRRLPAYIYICARPVRLIKKCEWSLRTR